MEQEITFGTMVSVRVLVAMPGQPRGRVLVVEWGPRVALLTRLGRYELVEVQSEQPEPTLPEPQPAPTPQPEQEEPGPEPPPGPDPAPAEAAAAGKSSRRRSSS